MEERGLDYRDPEWLAERLGMDKSTIYRYLQDGTLPGVQLGRKWLVSERLVLEFLDNETRRQTALRAGGVSPTRGHQDKFTERTQQALIKAEEEARALHHNFIGTEHILLGITDVTDCIAMFALQNLGIVPDRLRATVEGAVGQGQAEVTGEIGLTGRAKNVIQHAVDEARRLRHSYIGTEHLLPGLLLEREGVAAGVLEGQGADLDAIRKELARLLAAGSTPADWYAASPGASETPDDIKRVEGAAWNTLRRPVTVEMQDYLRAQPDQAAQRRAQESGNDDAADEPNEGDAPTGPT